MGDLWHEPARWPMWPVLPLVRGVARLEFGFLVDARTLSRPDLLATVFLGDVFSVFDSATTRTGLTTTLSRLDKRTYDSFDEIRADGWRVD